MTDQEKAGQILRQFIERDGLEILEDRDRIHAISMDLPLTMAVRHAIPQFALIGVVAGISHYRGETMSSVEWARFFNSSSKQLELAPRVISTCLEVWCAALDVSPPPDRAQVEAPPPGPQMPSTASIPPAKPPVSAPPIPNPPASNPPPAAPYNPYAAVPPVVNASVSVPPTVRVAATTAPNIGAPPGPVQPSQSAAAQAAGVQGVAAARPKTAPPPNWFWKNWSTIGFTVWTGLVLSAVGFVHSMISAVLTAANPSRDNANFSWQTAIEPMSSFNPSHQGGFANGMAAIWAILFPVVLIWQLVVVFGKKPRPQPATTIWTVLGVGCLLWSPFAKSYPALPFAAFMGMIGPAMLLKSGQAKRQSFWSYRWFQVCFGLSAALLLYDGFGLATTQFGDDVARVRVLVDKGFDAGIKDEAGQTLLDHTIDYLPDDLLRHMVVDRGDRLTPNGSTHLLTMTAINSPERIDLLLQAGADPNEKNAVGWTVLHTAASAGRGADVIGKLVEKGAKINAQTTDQKVTPLMVAYKAGGQSAQAILAAGPDLTLTDDHQRTALHYAAEYGSSSDLEKLLALKPPLEVVDSQDQTPLYYAAKRTDVGPAKTLKTAGANIYARAKKDGNWEPVMYASTKDMVDLLMPDPEPTGYTILHHAAAEGWLDVVEYLIEKKLDDPAVAFVDKDDKKVHTPETYARENHHEDVVGYLEKQETLWAKRDLAATWRVTDYWGTADSTFVSGVLTLTQSSQNGSVRNYTGKMTLTWKTGTPVVLGIDANLDRKELTVDLRETSVEGAPKWTKDTGKGKLDPDAGTVTGTVSFPTSKIQKFTFKK